MSSISFTGDQARKVQVCTWGLSMGATSMNKTADHCQPLLHLFKRSSWILHAMSATIRNCVTVSALAALVDWHTFGNNREAFAMDLTMWLRLRHVFLGLLGLSPFFHELESLLESLHLRATSARTCTSVAVGRAIELRNHPHRVSDPPPKTSPTASGTACAESARRALKAVCSSTWKPPPV